MVKPVPLEVATTESGKKYMIKGQIKNLIQSHSQKLSRATF